MWKISKKRFKIYSIVFCFLLSIYVASPQTALTLQQAIKTAQEKGLQSQFSNNTFEIANQTFRLQQAGLFPQVSLNANLPGYNSSINSVTQPDGTVKFTSVEQALSNIGISLNQKILATGGILSINTNINRFDRLTGNKSVNYNSQPLLVAINQPIFKFNEMALGLKTAKLNKLIGTKTFAESNENIALQTTQLYYQTLQAQVNINLAQFNINNIDTLLKLAKTKLDLGKIGEEEYLQIQLQSIDLSVKISQAKANYTYLKNKLCMMLNLPQTIELILDNSEPIPKPEN